MSKMTLSTEVLGRITIFIQTQGLGREVELTEMILEPDKTFGINQAQNAYPRLKFDQTQKQLIITSGADLIKVMDLAYIKRLI